MFSISLFALLGTQTWWTCTCSQVVRKANWTEVQYCLTRTKFALKEITDEVIYEAAQECSKEMNIPLTLDNTIHNTRSSGFERSEKETAAEIEDSISALNIYIQTKLQEEFRVRSDEKMLTFYMKACEAFNAGSEQFLDIEKLLYLVEDFDCLNANKTLLKTGVTKARHDISLGLPIRSRGTENLI